MRDGETTGAMVAPLDARDRQVEKTRTREKCAEAAREACGDSGRPVDGLGTAYPTEDREREGKTHEK